ncbi:hypothetical protein QN355_06250 [Cryobacterium sp. 10S3]|uniref:hypothetical protein n=1 Tax=Cryobacterium sp. 10S3 TaxID=3048582 RepID=UPI002AC8C195|nr:hypothetical protein [Cryobacterium sp. 10S3]MEB0286149.1 hypothetical protein [Cryobacterium sp. 10S3]WPX12207.1 hypothetical protein RHM57_10990 [Cryobacterium sp. 10S3]
MIEQPPTVPGRVPAPPGLTYPLRWRENNAAALAKVLASDIHYAKIPAAIREAFAVPFRSFYSALAQHTLAWAVHVGSSEELSRDWAKNRDSLPLPWGGKYQFSAEWGLLRMHTSAVTSTTSRDETLVHEFGHHIDETFGALWPGATDGTQNSLSGTPQFLAFWAQVGPNIPKVLYGSTNRVEWFAELWTTQIMNDSVTFLGLGGNDPTAAAAIRKLFTDRLPMPNLTGY